MFVDVTDLRNAQIQLDDARLREEENHLSELATKRAELEALGLYRTIFEGASIGILRVESDGRMVEANPAMEKMLGYTSAELAEMDLRGYSHAEDVEYNLALFKELMAGELDSYQLEKRCYRKDGTLIWVQVTAALKRDAQGRPGFEIAMLEDITDRKVVQEALLRQAQMNEHQALHDALTGLPNRRKLYSEMERILGGLSEQDSVAIALFDLDGFKAYNDTFGHPAGDALLARLGRRLAAAVEGRGIAYRMGGDEFCVLTYSSSDAEMALKDACAALSEQGEQFAIRCSRGSAEIPGEAGTLERALQLADERLYADKRAGRLTESLEGRDALVQLIAEQKHRVRASANR
ncbi:MAG: diguanylate cyclase domain-containing protein [Gaiellaceae bacterium]